MILSSKKQLISMIDILRAIIISAISKQIGETTIHKIES